MEPDDHRGSESAPTGREGGPHARPAPVYVGFQEGRGGLYEFWTASGQYVYLSETDCVDMQYRPLCRQLVLTFECVGTELMEAGIVVLTFDDAEIYQWETDFEGTDWTAADPRVRGQVNDLFGWRDYPDSDNLTVSFHLSLFDVSVSFFASIVTCEVRDGPWQPRDAAQ